MKRLLSLLVLPFAGCATIVIPPANPADDYWVGHSCNAAVADWLIELGCAVPARTVTANYRVLPPGTPVEEEGHP